MVTHHRTDTDARPYRCGLRRAARLVTVCAGLWAAPAAATPFLPANDAVVLERLPDARDGAARSLRADHRRLAAHPHDLALALKVAAADLDRSRALGDPRYLGRAQAALAAWPPSSAAPPRVLLLRAVILQSNHDFDNATKLLVQVLQADPSNGQALLTRASIRLLQADYAGSLADCGQLAAQRSGLVPDTCTAAAMAMTGHAALALRALALSLRENDTEAKAYPGVALWAVTLAAETASKLQDPATEPWFTRARAIDPADPYLLAAWSDWLLDHARPREVIGLLAERTRIDPLLLRLALAERQVGASAADGHVADLAMRFEASRLRGDTVHRREEARFQLVLMHNPQRALALAAANWNVQREAADARILLEAALAAGRPAAAAPVLAWMHANGVEDDMLTRLATRLQPTARG